MCIPRLTKAQLNPVETDIHPPFRICCLSLTLNNTSITETQNSSTVPLR